MISWEFLFDNFKAFVFKYITTPISSAYISNLSIHAPEIVNSKSLFDSLRISDITTTSGDLQIDLLSTGGTFKGAIYRAGLFLLKYYVQQYCLEKIDSYYKLGKYDESDGDEDKSMIKSTSTTVNLLFKTFLLLLGLEIVFFPFEKIIDVYRIKSSNMEEYSTLKNTLRAYLEENNENRLSLFYGFGLQIFSFFNRLLLPFVPIMFPFNSYLLLISSDKSTSPYTEFNQNLANYGFFQSIGKFVLVEYSAITKSFLDVSFSVGYFSGGLSMLKYVFIKKWYLTILLPLFLF